MALAAGIGLLLFVLACLASGHAAARRRRAALASWDTHGAVTVGPDGIKHHPPVISLAIVNKNTMAKENTTTTPPAKRRLKRRRSFDPALRAEIIGTLLDAGIAPAVIARQLRGNYAATLRRVRSVARQRREAAIDQALTDAGYPPLAETPRRPVEERRAVASRVEAAL